MWSHEKVDNYKSVLEEITEEQKKILKKFRESLDVELNYKHTDELLVKFLRAKNFNLEGAKKIFLENYYNRFMFGINTILETYQKPEVAEIYETMNNIGFARDGTLIQYMAAGQIDLYGFIMSMSCHTLCVYFSYVMEEAIQILEEENKKTGKNVTEITYIIDLEEFSLQNVLHKSVIEMALDYLRLSQDCYPEIWRNVLIVNAPRIFHTAFSLLKPVLRPVFKDRIHIIDKDSTKHTLLRYIDEDVLPAFLGGNRVDSKGDPLCREFIKFGGQIPEKFYSENSKVLLSLGDPSVRAVHIGPRSAFNMVIVVKEAYSVVNLVARTEGGSVYLSLFYKEFGPDPDHPELPGEFENLEANPEYQQVSVEIRGQLHCAQEDCEMQTPWAGIYVTRFSNATNWFTPRKLYYKYTITPPKPQDQVL